MKSTADGAVPSDFYSTNDIAGYENISSEQMHRYARLTLDKAVREAQKADMKIQDWANYYNTHRNGLITDQSLNIFYLNDKLAPFAHLFKMFVVRRKCKQSNAVRLCCGYGIRKTYYDKYKKTGQLPPMDNQGKLPKYDRPARAGRSKVEFEGGGRIDIPMNSTYRRFKDGIDACNKISKTKVTVPEMVLLAIQEFMQKRKNIFGEQIIEIDDSKLIERTNERLYVDADSELVKNIYNFLQRYNAAYTPPLTMSEFMEKAAKAHLERMPLELVSPETAKKLKAVEEMEKKRNGQY